jgi:hypothetical protein
MAMTAFLSRRCRLDHRRRAAHQGGWTAVNPPALPNNLNSFGEPDANVPCPSTRHRPLATAGATVASANRQGRANAPGTDRSGRRRRHQLASIDLSQENVRLTSGAAPAPHDVAPGSIVPSQHEDRPALIMVNGRDLRNGSKVTVPILHKASSLARVSWRGTGGRTPAATVDLTIADIVSDHKPETSPSTCN